MRFFATLRMTESEGLANDTMGARNDTMGADDDTMGLAVKRAS